MTARKAATPKIGDKNLAGQIRELRRSMGLIAAKVGVAFSTVNHWESGKSRPLPLAMRQIEELMERTWGQIQDYPFGRRHVAWNRKAWIGAQRRQESRG